MRKILSWVLCFALSMSLMPTLIQESYAEGEEKSAGQKLLDLGLLKGDLNGNLMEYQNLKRQDALLLLLRMLGEDQKAESYAGVSSFSDVSPDSYYYKYIAYAEDSKLTKGMGNGEFGIDKLITEKEFLTFILRTLGYTDISWDEVLTKADKLGLTDGLYPDENAEALRAKVFEYMLAALNANVKGTDIKLGSKLDLKGFEIAKNDNEIQANGTFSVQKIDLISLKNFNIVFTHKVKDYDVDKFHIKVDNMNYELALNEDGRTVSVIFKNPQSKNKKVKLRIKDIQSQEGNTLESYEEEIVLKDDTEPKLLDASFLDLKTLRLKFSEPVSLSSKSYESNKSIELDGKNPKIKIDKNKLGDCLFITFLEPVKLGEHQLKISRIKDYGQNPMKDEILTVEAKQDNSEPVATSVKFINSKKVLVYFNEPIYQRGMFKIGDKNASSKQYFDDSKEVLEISFPSDIGVSALNNGVLKYKGQEDKSGNKVKDWESIDFEVYDDTSLPEAEMSFEKNKILIKFDKPVDNAYGSVALYDRKNEKKLDEISAPFAFEKGSNNRLLKVEFKKYNFANKNSETFYLRVEGFRDLTFRKNQMIKLEEKIESIDLKKPTLLYNGGKEAVKITKSESGYKEDSITIRFSEPMDEDDLRNLANYRISGFGQLSGVEGAYIEGIYDEDQTVVIVVPNARKINSSNKFTILAIRDKAGNMMDTVEDARKTGRSNFRLNSAVLVKKNELLLTYSKEVEVFDTEAYEVKRSSDEIEFIESYEINEKNKKEVKIILMRDLPSDSAGYSMRATDSIGSIRSTFGEELGSTSSVSVIDNVGASVEEIEAKDGKFIVTMSEPIYFKEGEAKSISENIIITDEESYLLTKDTDYTVNKRDGDSGDYVRVFEIRGKKNGPKTFVEGNSYNIEIIAAYNKNDKQSISQKNLVEAVGGIE